MRRILWNTRPSESGAGGDIDEIVMENVTVHIEQMSDRDWWIGLYTDDPDVYWMGDFVADSRGRMRFVQGDDAGIEWEEDRAHDEPRDDARTADDG